MITDAPGIAIGVETADCVPVLLFDPEEACSGRCACGLAEYRKKDRPEDRAPKMHEEFGSEPARLIAAIGPAIGPECYEVDEPVMGRVREAFLVLERGRHAARE